MKTRAATPPEDKMKNNYYHTEAVEIIEKLRANESRWQDKGNKRHLQGTMEETFV